MRWPLILVVLTVLAIQQPLYGAGITELPFSERAKLASAVILAVAVSDERRLPSEKSPATFVRFDVELVLKGSPPDKMEVIIETGVPELDLHCCRKGDHYLLFLKKRDGNRYYSVNGKYGALRVVSN